jgi:hypothetical protein
LRVVGLVVLVLLLAAGVAERLRVEAQADRILAGEQRANDRVYSLYRASRSAVRRGPHPGLAELIAEHPSLEMLPDVSDAVHDYAANDEYIYGLTRPQRLDKDGALTHGFILRAWPRRFGITGDLEFYVDDIDGFWFGQNELGRSGLDEGFPPPFPQPNLGDGDGSAWWQTHRDRD